MSIVGNPLLMSGGGGVTPYIVNITCDSEFAGQVISMEQAGQTTVSALCPTSAPYVVTLKPKYSGTWTIKGTVSGTVYTSSVSLSAWGTYTAGLNVAKVYGISRDITNSSPEWTRTDDAVGFTAVASVGTEAGSSSFDSCYPYSQIVRETINGDVMVKIPKFWYRRYREGNIEYIKIADHAKPDFALHPAFQHNDTTQDYIYVGAYKMTTEYTSKSGLTPISGLTRATVRSGCANRGTGYGQLDITSLSAIQILMMVEFATNDMQTAIGGGYSGGGASSRIITGSCDNVPNLTGRPSGTSILVDVVYRGIEALWGNGNEFVDGLVYNSGQYWICNNQSNYTDSTTTNYTQLGYSGSTGWAASYITEMGYDSNNQAIMLPKTASGGGSTTYYTDSTYGGSGYKVPTHGGASQYGYGDGLFTFIAFESTSTTSFGYVSRLIYIPQQEET